METAKHPMTKIWLRSIYTHNAHCNLQYVFGPFTATAVYGRGWRRTSYKVAGPCGFSAMVKNLREAKVAVIADLARPDFKFC